VSKTKKAKLTNASLDKINMKLAGAFATTMNSPVDDSGDETPGTAVAVGEPTVIAGQVAAFADAQQSKLARCIADARRAFTRLRSNMVDDITAVAESVHEAKRRAHEAKVPFESLFGDPADETKFPFSQSLANRFIRIHKSGILCTDAQALPADLNSLDALASVPAKERPRVLKEFERELAESKDGRIAEKMRRAKAVVVKERSPKLRTKFVSDTKQIAKRLEDDFLDADLPDDAGPIRKAMHEQGRAKRAAKQQPKAAPEGDLDVEALVRAFVTDNALTTPMLSQAVTVLKKIMEERK
jgi:hypothetical protein